MNFNSTDFPKLFSKFLNLHRTEQWYTAHSHHFWPDCTQQAVLDYWNDSARYVDDKWDIIFGEKIPLIKSYLAEWLEISHTNQFAFAPNTHEIVYRLLTSFKPGKKIKVLTTKSEFHSFSRQIKIFEEQGLAEVDYVATEPYENFKKQMLEKVNTSYDLIFLSHVFFNSGMVIDKQTLDHVYMQTKDSNTLVVLDAYHSFMALPFSMKPYEEHFCYLAGSYKYAGAGEGFCFMYIPPKWQLEPIYSGWFADFSGLSAKGDKIKYDQGASSMLGSTMDYSTLYKLISVLKTYKDLNITPEAIHQTVLQKQVQFLEHIQEMSFTENILQSLKIKNIILSKSISKPDEFSSHGHFLAFDCGNTETCSQIHRRLKENKIFTDFRNARIRFGFGVFQNWNPNLSSLND